MTAPHIRRRQLDEAIKAMAEAIIGINAERRAAASAEAQANTAAGEQDTPPAVEQETMPEDHRRPWYESQNMNGFGYEICQRSDCYSLNLYQFDMDGLISDPIYQETKQFELTAAGYVDCFNTASAWLSEKAAAGHPMREYVQHPVTPPQEALAGLGMNPGDLAAVRDKVMEAFRPLQSEHYRAMFMSAVIQGSIAADKALPPESMAMTALHYADAACKELGL